MVFYKGFHFLKNFLDEGKNFTFFYIVENLKKRLRNSIKTRKNGNQCLPKLNLKNELHRLAIRKGPTIRNDSNFFLIASFDGVPT